LRALDSPQCGPYQTIGILGRGGNGIVYLAKHRDSGAVVALKIADKAVSGSERGLAREAAILSGLSRTHIVRLLDQGEFDGHAYLALEYVDGLPVDRCARDLDLRERVRCFRSLCGAIAHAHRMGVIHRDLSPRISW
jgi:serine/threonine-protein kinase